MKEATTGWTWDSWTRRKFSGRRRAEEDRPYRDRYFLKNTCLAHTCLYRYRLCLSMTSQFGIRCTICIRHIIYSNYCALSRLGTHTNLCYCYSLENQDSAFRCCWHYIFLQITKHCRNYWREREFWIFWFRFDSWERFRVRQHFTEAQSENAKSERISFWFQITL